MVITEYNRDSCKREVMSTGGASLRDYFAAKAMQGMASDPEIYFGTNEKPYNPWPWIAEQAYKAADAMLEARKK
jgi:hypothetical protein